jgi:hypothetical protein
VKSPVVEEYQADDFKIHATRTWDDPNSYPKMTHIVVGGVEVKNFPSVVPQNQQKDFLFPGKYPVVWYAVDGCIQDQKDMILFEVLPECINRRSCVNAQILWIPSNANKEWTDFREDSMQILDAFTKMHEYNIHYWAKFEMGLGTHFYSGLASDTSANVKIERLNLSIQVLSQSIIGCRFLNLSKYTTISTKQKTKQKRRSELKLKTTPLNVETQQDIHTVDNKYNLAYSGWTLSNRGNRRMRESIRRTLFKHKVSPDWTLSQHSGSHRSPMMKAGVYILALKLQILPPFPLLHEMIFSPFFP